MNSLPVGVDIGGTFTDFVMSVDGGACILYSFINPTHAQAVRARILQRGLLQGW
jgi:hypothetical protein